MKTVAYYKALADETRLRLVHVLQHHELSVNEIVALFNTGQSRVSHHLKILFDSGFLNCRRDGVWSFYTVRAEGNGRRLVDASRFLFADDPVLHADLRRAETIVTERSARTRAFFDTIAPDWDLLKREIMGPFDLNAALTEYLPRCSALADLGCGTGDFLARSASLANRTIGVDSSAKMLDQARRRFNAGSDGSPELRLGELEHLPIRNEEVDCVTISMALHHLTAPQAALAEAYRVLTGGGTLVIADLDKHTNEEMRKTYGDRWLGFTGAEMETFLTETGFNLLDCRSFPLRKGLVVTLYKAQKPFKGE